MIVTHNLRSTSGGYSRSGEWSQEMIRIAFEWKILVSKMISKKEFDYWEKGFEQTIRNHL